MIFASFRLLVIITFRIVGVVAFYCSKKRKKVALQNVDLCFSKRFKLSKNKLVKDSYVSLGHCLADFLLLRLYNRDNIDKYVKSKNLFYLQEALNKGRGVILSTAHFGSWELAAHCFALKGFKSIILYNPIKKPAWLESFIKKTRELSGNVLIAKQASLLTIYRHLIKGRIVTVVADQHCSSLDGQKVPFFGVNAWTHTSLIKLSLKTGAPILSGFIYTKNLFEYEIEICKPLWPKTFLATTNSEYQMVCASNNNLESAILKHPGHWMWQHKRFKDL